VGKNWSPYYEVAAFTDRFEGAGGQGTGTYNALTDGGNTGTGRADRAVQGTLSTDFLPHKVFKPFDLNLQLQHGNPIPFGEGAEYGTAVGASAVMTTRGNYTLGLAYNYASIDLDRNPSLRSIGLTGPARAILVGTRAFGERWYAGLSLARLENQETTDEGTYLDGWGSEFCGQYRVTDRVWLVGGYNILEPDSDQTLAGDFRIRYGMLGLRYSFEDFRRMIWANVRINDGLNEDGTPRPNVYTIGVRWDLSKRGWHMSQ
jgi:predicted porin